MSVPVSTSTFSFAKPAAGGDPYEDATLTTIATGVPGHLSRPSGNEKQVGGTQEVVDAVLLCDPVDGVDHYCTVTDENTGDTYWLRWVRIRAGLGLDHLQAGVFAVKGQSGG